MTTGIKNTARKKAPQRQLLVQKIGQRQRNHHLQRYVNEQKGKGVGQRFPEQPVVQQVVVVGQPGKLHGRNDIPVMEGEHDRKDDRKSHKQQQVKQVGAHHQVGQPALMEACAAGGPVHRSGIVL